MDDVIFGFARNAPYGDVDERVTSLRRRAACTMNSSDRSRDR